MSEPQAKQHQDRGSLAPQKKNWNEEESDEEDNTNTNSNPNTNTKQDQEEEFMPRKNRDQHTEKQTFKAKFTAREAEPQRNNNRNQQYRYKKQYNDRNDRNDRNNRNNYSDKNKTGERNHQNRNNQQREKREVGKGINRTNQTRRDDNRGQELKGANQNEDYRIQQLPRMPLPNYTNKIDIKSNDSDKYLTLAKDMLKEFEFITLRGVGKMIGYTFSIAENICQNIKNLDRINIPATDKVQEILHPRRAGLLERRRTKYIPMIIIELSKKKLEERHIGHQTYKNKEYADDYKRPQRRAKKQYQQKQ